MSSEDFPAYPSGGTPWPPGLAAPMPREREPKRARTTSPPAGPVSSPMHGNMLDMLHLQQLYGMLGNIGDLRFHGASPTARVASPAESLSTPPYALPAALQQPMYGVPGQSFTAHTPGLQHPGMHAGAHSQHGGQYANVTSTTPLQGTHFFSRPSSAHAAGGPLARHGSGHSAQMPPSLDPARAPLSVASARPEREQFNLDHAQAIADRAASNGASLTTGTCPLARFSSLHTTGRPREPWKREMDVTARGRTHLLVPF